MIWRLLLGGISWAQPCPDPDVLTDSVKEALLSGQLELAEQRMDAVEEALGCSPLPDASFLAKLWLIEGARLYFLEDRFGTEAAFRSAARLAPSLWFPEFGERLRAVYQQAVPHGGEEPTAEIVFGPIPDRMQGALNGEITTFPTTVPYGAQLVQVIAPDDTARYARMLMLPPGESIQIEAPYIEPDPPRKRWWLLGASGAALVVAGSAALAAQAQQDNIPNADSLNELEQIQSRQRTFVGVSYGFTGVAVLGGTIFFAF